MNTSHTMYGHQRVDNLCRPLDNPRYGQRIHWRTVARLSHKVLLESLSWAFHHKCYFQPPRHFPECSAVECNNVRVAKFPAEIMWVVLRILFEKTKPGNYGLRTRGLGWLVDWLLNRWIDCLIDLSTVWLMTWLIDWLIYGWMNGLTDGSVNL